MSKIKVNNGLGSILLLGGLFAGWQTLLVVTALILLFGEVDDAFKGIVVRVVTFAIGLAIVTIGWNLIVDVYSALVGCVDGLKAIILSYDNTASLEFFVKIHQYVLNPVKIFLDCIDSIVGILLTLAKLSFVVAIISNKAMKENVITKKINEYVTKVINYVNSIDFPAK